MLRDPGRNGVQFSWLGLAQAPVVSWAVLPADVQNIRTVASARRLFSTDIGIVRDVLCCNVLDDGLRDAADPYTH